MPTVPTIRTAPIPGVRVVTGAPSAAFGANAAIDFSGPLRVAQQIEQEQRDKVDQVRLLDSDNALADLSTTLQTDALNRRGKAAFGALQDARTAWQQGVSQIEGSLSSDRQREMFAARASARWNALHETVERHTASEAQRFDDDTTQAAIKNRLSDAAANYQDVGIVAGNAAEVRAITQDYGTRNGWSDEQIQQKTSEQLSTLHTAVIGRFLDAGDDRAASAYYDEHKDQIAGDDQGKIARALGESSTLGAAQRAVDGILAAKDVRPTDALTQAEAIDDPKVRQQAIQLLTQHYGNQERLQKIERDDAAQRLIRDMEQNNGRLNRGSLDWQLLDGTPEGLHVLSVQGDMLHPVEKGDPDKYLSFLSMSALSPQSRQQLAATPIADVMRDPTMSAGQKSSVINMIRSAKQEARTLQLTDLRQKASDASATIKEMQRTLKSRVDAEGNAISDEQAKALHNDLLDAEVQAKLLDMQIARIRSGEDLPPSSHTDTSTPAASQTSAGNAFGLSAGIKPTETMLLEAGAKNDGYAAYLRSMGVALPAVLPKPQPEKPKK